MAEEIYTSVSLCHFLSQSNLSLINETAKHLRLPISVFCETSTINMMRIIKSSPTTTRLTVIQIGKTFVQCTGSGQWSYTKLFLELQVAFIEAKRVRGKHNNKH